MTPSRRSTLCLAAALALASLVTLAPVASAEVPATRPATRPAEASASDFVRFLDDDQGGGDLQTSIVRYQNDAGDTVDLIGAIHIADPAYFRALSDRFDGYDAVLYEQVKPRDPANFDPGSLSWVGVLQQTMKQALGLSFQLEAIDYSRENFVHADMDAETFLARQADRGESIFGLMLQSMLRESLNNLAAPEGSPNATPPGPSMEELTAALAGSDPRRAIKLVLGRQLSQVDRLIAAMEPPGGSVLLSERNVYAMDVLERQLAEPSIDGRTRTLGVFYGAAHLKGMSEILTGDLGFRRVGDPTWLTAWDLTDAPTPPTTRPAN